MGLNYSAAAAGSSPSYTRPTGLDTSALLGSASSTSSFSRATSCFTGLAPQRNTDKQTACTDICASAPRNGNSQGHKARFSSPLATPWFPAIPGFAHSVPPYSLVGHTCGLRRATVSGGWTISSTALPRTLSRHVLHHPLPRRPGTDQDRPPVRTLLNRPGRRLGILVPTTPPDWTPSPQDITEL